ncbi:class I SAM-dependent methyltransferase [Ruegeria arenilitoris]|uniref:class I SAM-dependent methyltransferase n=1 Tax=Ruegeria arenilitoris TaxID=1173585 RepID=UPI00147EF9F5|nr:class I SAM-dependent methyltransferase [Ruegeria arenilitoris]
MATISKDAAFWSKISRKYAASPIGNMDGYRNTLERTKSHLKPSDNALEMGCGTGSTALLLAPHVANITATDIAPGMIEIAQEKLDQGGPENVKFKVAEVQDHARDNGCYDVVMAHNLLHLLPDLDEALTVISKITKTEGLFISKTVCAPNKTGLKYGLIRHLAIPVMQAIGKAPFVKFVSAKELERKIEDAGFKILETGDQAGTMLSRYIIARKT